MDYFGARYYDSRLGFWTSVDPLADKNIVNSPYAYCSGNPIMMIDPDGRDDYSIDENGIIQRVKETKDKFDRLGTLNEDGSFNEDNFVKIRDKSLLPGITNNSETYKGKQGERIVNFAVGKNGTEVAKMFLFAANNSAVEWNMCAFYDKGYRRYGISTSHSDETVLPAYQTNALSISGSRLLFNVHTHCRMNGTAGANDSDMYNLYRQFKSYFRDGRYAPLHYVYHIGSGELYHYTPWNNYPIRNMKKFPNYSGLNFLIP